MKLLISTSTMDLKTKPLEFHTGGKKEAEAFVKKHGVKLVSFKEHAGDNGGHLVTLSGPRKNLKSAISDYNEEAVSDADLDSWLVGTKSAKSEPKDSSAKVNAVLKSAVKSLESFKGSTISVIKADSTNVFKVKLSSSIKGGDLQKLMDDLSFIAKRKDWLEIQSGSILLIRVSK